MKLTIIIIYKYKNPFRLVATHVQLQNTTRFEKEEYEGLNKTYIEFAGHQKCLPSFELYKKEPMLNYFGETGVSQKQKHVSSNLRNFILELF